MSAERDDEDLEAFLDEAEQALPGEKAAGARKPGPTHRQLTVMVSDDRLEAHLETVFPDTTRKEVAGALRQAGVVAGICEEELAGVLARADRSGHTQRDVLVAQGRPAVYTQRREVRCPFLEGLRDPKTGDDLHLASSPFRSIAEPMEAGDLTEVQEYAIPVVAVSAAAVLMEVEGEDIIEPGMDVFGRAVREIPGDERSPVRAGGGVEEAGDGGLRATQFGYVSLQQRRLSVVSPVWVSPDRMEVYFVNPPDLGEHKHPTAQDIDQMLASREVCAGIEEEAIAELCEDLQRDKLRESCIRIARGRHADPSGLAFTPIPEAQFEALVDAFRARSLNQALAASTKAAAVHAGQLLAEPREAGEGLEPGVDVFGEPALPPREVAERKPVRPGPNVKEEAGEASARLVSEIYGYAGLLAGEVRVVSPVIVSPDRMAVHFVALGEEGTRVLPTSREVVGLLERAKVVHGVDEDAIAALSKRLPTGEDGAGAAAELARGTPPEPGREGKVELLFQQLPDAGKVLEDGVMDFRARSAVPQVAPGQLLATRQLPVPGKPGTDVRGREVAPPKLDHGLLFAGPNVTQSEESGEEGDIRQYYAEAAGWARVVRDTLAVLQRYQHPGDLDYAVGNITMDGDVEVGGTIKSRFEVEATGDVLIGGAVERSAKITAEGNVVVKGGIIGAQVKATGDVHAQYIQDSRIVTAGDLVISSYIQDSEVKAGGKAVVGGEEVGESQLCLVGGSLMAAVGVDVSFLGSEQGRETQVIAGIDLEVEGRLAKYTKGLSFCETRAQRAMRTLQKYVPSLARKEAVVAAIRRADPGRRKVLHKQLKELDDMGKVRTSLEYHLKELQGERQEAAERARVWVRNTAYERVTVQIGDTSHTLKARTERPVFRLDETHGRVLFSP